MRRLTTLMLIAMAATCLVAPPVSAVPSPLPLANARILDSRASQPPNGWVRREVPNWIYWTPTSKWVATHNKNGIDVSSPSGDIVVTYGWASSAYQMTTQEVIDYIFAPQNTTDFTNLRITKQGEVTGPPGDQKQKVSWTGIRRHPLKGKQSVRGEGEVHVFVVGYGAFGFTATGIMAPVRQWKSNLTTMRTVLRHITYLPS